MLEQTLELLDALKKSHEASISAKLFAKRSSEPSKSLERLVDPVIIRLSESKHLKQLQDECP